MLDSNEHKGMHGLTLVEKLDALPTNPGVYQFRNSDGKVIYVGKAKNLRNRVRSYFQEGRPRDAKTKVLVSKVVDLETIVTDSAVEALILEDTLIKKLKPRYNIMLRDDKTYPYVRVTNEPFPRIFPTRRIVRDGSRYFGPYTDVKYVRYLLKTLRSIFPIRSCDLNLNAETIGQKKFKVCLDYHIGKCEGPCEALVGKEHYNAMIEQVVQVLKGRTRDLEKSMREEMEIYAGKMMFEEAAKVRDRLEKVREYNAKQKVVSEDLTDRDIVSFAREDDDAAAVILKIREGRLVGKRQHYLSGVLAGSDEDILESIIREHYLKEQSVPEEVLVQFDPGEDFELLQQFLTDRRGEGRVRIVVPKIGDKQKLVEMARANAELLLGELKLQRMKRADMIPHSLQSLGRDLRLKHPPRRIECFDNSNLHGTDPVSSMVCFVDGKPRRSEYRKFKVRGVEGPDDFASMREVVTRRYKRVLQEGLALPDLIVIDGGKGQVSAAAESLKELDLDHIPLIGLAKRLEEIVVPGQSDTLLLPKSSSSLRLLQQIRDEAHRFAITFHRTLREKRTIQTELTQIPGVGARTAKKIIEMFGSARGASAATLEELQQKLGTKTGSAVFDYFHNRSGEATDADAPGVDDAEIGDISANAVTSAQDEEESDPAATSTPTEE